MRTCVHQMNKLLETIVNTIQWSCIAMRRLAAEVVYAACALWCATFAPDYDGWWDKAGPIRTNSSFGEGYHTIRRRIALDYLSISESSLSLSFFLSLCLSIYPPIYLYLSISLSFSSIYIDLSIDLSIYIMYEYIYVHIYLSIYLSTRLVNTYQYTII
jgi:hypothetical protein